MRRGMGVSKRLLVVRGVGGVIETFQARSFQMFQGAGEEEVHAVFGAVHHAFESFVHGIDGALGVAYGRDAFGDFPGAVERLAEHFAEITAVEQRRSAQVSACGRAAKETPEQAAAGVLVVDFSEDGFELGNGRARVVQRDAMGGLSLGYSVSGGAGHFGGEVG